MEQINFAQFFGHLAVYLLVWIFALTAHGWLTARLSNHFGDDTAKNEGRISLNPFVQTDLLGTIVLPTIAFALGWLAAGIPFVGWGKRVPIKAENWRNPKIAGVVVTLAGTFASIFIAVVCFGLLKILLASEIANAGDFLEIIFSRNPPVEFSWLAPIQIILWYGLAINTVLALFSLIPIPPFGGGVALFSLLPESLKPVKTFFEQFGLVIALLFIYLVGINYIFAPLLNSILRSLIG